MLSSPDTRLQRSGQHRASYAFRGIRGHFLLGDADTLKLLLLPPRQRKSIANPLYRSQFRNELFLHVQSCIVYSWRFCSAYSIMYEIAYFISRMEYGICVNTSASLNERFFHSITRYEWIWRNPKSSQDFIRITMEMNTIDSKPATLHLNLPFLTQYLFNSMNEKYSRW